MKGIDIKIIVAIVIAVAIVLFSIMLATGALEPFKVFAGENTISNVLDIFGLREGT